MNFLFPNDFNIYLHDTPNDELFNKDVRAFSHGCIRLEKPDEMAQFVLGWDMDRVHAAMNGGGDNKSVTLKHPIPVFITYFTTYVTDGQLFFGNDLYNRDDALVTKWRRVRSCPRITCAPPGRCTRSPKSGERTDINHVTCHVDVLLASSARRVIQGYRAACAPLAASS